MRRLEFEDARYHGSIDNQVKSRGPRNGQDALDTSVQVSSTSSRRVGIDYETAEFVVFQKTIGNAYHGHVRSWSDLSSQMQNALQRAGMTDKRGRI
jgi:filamentous hemagglutinin